MEEAIAKRGRARYGSENEVRAEIDPKTGETHVSRYLLVVETVDNATIQISLEDARRAIRPPRSATPSPTPLPPLEYGRIAAQSAKQVIVQKVREAERDRQYEEYKDRIGDIVNGIVKRVEYGNVVVDLGRGEGDRAPRRDAAARGVPQRRPHPRLYLRRAPRDRAGRRFSSRARIRNSWRKLFAQEVPEIYDGIVEIKAVARDPGSRAKIAVISRDSSIDPVGACVGMRGSRVQAVVQRTAGREDRHHSRGRRTSRPSSSTRWRRPKSPRWCSTKTRERIEVVVPDQQLSLAIGRRGQNVRLASQLTGWDIDILTEQEESERRQAEFENRTAHVHGRAQRRRGDRPIAGLRRLRARSRTSLCRSEGTRRRSKASTRTPPRSCRAARMEYLDHDEAELDAKRSELGVDDELKEVEGVTTAMLVALRRKRRQDVEDLAGCATDDLLGYYERPRTRNAFASWARWRVSISAPTKPTPSS